MTNYLCCHVTGEIFRLKYEQFQTELLPEEFAKFGGSLGEFICLIFGPQQITNEIIT